MQLWTTELLSNYKVSARGSLSAISLRQSTVMDAGRLERNSRVSIPVFRSGAERLGSCINLQFNERRLAEKSVTG